MGVFTTIVGMLGVGAISLTNWSLGTSLFVSSAFIVSLIAVAAIGYVYDTFMTPNKKVYWTQNVFGGFAFALFLPMVLGLFGVSSIATTSNIASMTTVALLVSSIALEFAGFFVAKKLKLA
jgi:hypothetical protein